LSKGFQLRARSISERAEEQTAVLASGRDCQRPAVKGWTTCGKHYTAGKSLKQVKR